MKPFYHLVNLFSLLFSLFCSLDLNGQIKELVEKQIAIDGELVTYYESIDPTASPTIIDARLSIGEGCTTATSVTINGDPVQASLAGATNSGIIPTCATSATIYDIWFITQADANGYLDIDFDPVGTNSRDFGITVWTSCDGNSNSQMRCDNAPVKFSGIGFGLSRLTANQTVYIQLWTYTPSTQEVIISTESKCGPEGTSVGEQICNNETATYSQAMEVGYYTILDDPINIQIKTRSGTVIYSTLIPKTITT